MVFVEKKRVWKLFEACVTTLVFYTDDFFVVVVTGFCTFSSSKADMQNPGKVVSF